MGSEVSPGNFHGMRDLKNGLRNLKKLHPEMSKATVRAIIVSEWYHAGLTAKALWCQDDCREEFPVARLLDDNFAAIRAEVVAFLERRDSQARFSAVGTNTASADQLLAGNGSWKDVTLWRGRAFHKELCSKHFPKLCGVVTRLPEIWTSPWSHVMLSVLGPESWVPFHHGTTNAQL